MNCLYCGTGLRGEEGSCHKCGAPTTSLCNITISPYGRCVCELNILDKIVHYKIKTIVCHTCFRTFEGEFDAEYSCDKIYPNGQITHVYKTAEPECPYCNAIFGGHEFYHGLTVDDSGELLVKRALKTREKIL